MTETTQLTHHEMIAVATTVTEIDYALGRAAADTQCPNADFETLIHYAKTRKNIIERKKMH